MPYPKLIVVGGPNGSGKTTFILEYLKTEPLPYLSADAIAYELDPVSPQANAIQASRLFSSRLDEHLKNKQSCIIESTLSGRSLQKKLEHAKSLGFYIELIYLFLDSPELCNKRIEERVQRGGHFVPPQDVERRFYRSRQNFGNTYKLICNEWNIYYNPENQCIFVATGNRSNLETINDPLFKQFQQIGANHE